MSIRGLVKAVGELPPVKRYSIWLADRRFDRWQDHHPGRPFSDFYSDHVGERLEKGLPHPSLGAVAYNHQPLGYRNELAGSSFGDVGYDHWLKFAGNVPSRSTRLVDYGCGSLRLGQHAVRYLDPGCYWGIDVSSRFLGEGRTLLGPKLIADKQPRLDLIDDATIDRIHRWKPDAIISNAVLQHVPPEELPAYFERLARMMVAGTRAVIMFIPDARLARVKAMSWAQPPRLLEGLARLADRSAVVGFQPVEGREDPRSPGRRQMMVVERPR